MIWASYFENFCQQANSNIFSSPWTCLTKKQYGHLQLITLCQYTLCSNAFFGSWFMFIYKLGIEPKHNSKPFLFYQSLQEILLRVKIQRLSHVYPAPKYLQLWSAHIDPPSILQYLSFFASRVLWKWFFLCWKSSQNYLLSCCNLSSLWLFFAWALKLLPLKSYKCLASKVVKEFL